MCLASYARKSLSPVQTVEHRPAKDTLAWLRRDNYVPNKRTEFLVDSFKKQWRLGKTSHDEKIIACLALAQDFQIERSRPR